jgi:uncharacterized membrane protein
MGGAHSHTGNDVDHVETARTPRAILLTGLALAAVATVVGLVVLWPSGDRPSAEFSAPGVTFPEATVVKVYEACPVLVADPSVPPAEREDFPDICNKLEAELASGERVVADATPPVVTSGLEPGDEIKLSVIPSSSGGKPHYSWYSTERDFPLGLMSVLFVVVVAVVARLRGVLALVGLGFAGLVVWKFMLPALLGGGDGLGVALTGSAAIMFVVLYLAHGPSVRTSTALAGTLTGVGIISLLTLYAVDAVRLSGIGHDEEFLRTLTPDLDFRGVLTCAIIIAGLGILNDVTITQSSSVWELRAAAPEMSRRRLYASAMRIGRDHIASTIYTIVFVYAGTAIAALMLIALYDRSFTDVVSSDAIAEEIVRTLASAIGLVLAVPATTAIAAATVGGATTARDGGASAPA